MPSARSAARRCLHTGAATALEVDHIMPRNQGGTGDLSNLQDLCIADAYPVTPGHSLVIPRRHVSDGLELHQPEWNAVVELLKRRREQLSGQDASINGWACSLNENRGLNSGEAAGQTVLHAHWHLNSKAGGGLWGIACRQAY